ncbi:MAG: hypothetical protein ABIG40_00315 [Parcubacteria group bacterium]
MVKIKKLTLEEKERLREMELVKQKILDLMGLKTSQKTLNEQIEAIKEFLRNYVENSPMGLTLKKYKFWEKDICDVKLQDNPQHETEVGLQRAVDFLTINRTAVSDTIDAKALEISHEDLEKITKTTYGKKKVIPYYGLKNLT